MQNPCLAPNAEVGVIYKDLKGQMCREPNGASSSLFPLVNSLPDPAVFQLGELNCNGELWERKQELPWQGKQKALWD